MGIFSLLFKKRSAQDWNFDLPCLNTNIKPKQAIDQYFSLLEDIRSQRKNKDYYKMICSCLAIIEILPAMASRWVREYGSFDISSILAIDVGCTYLAVLKKEKHLLKIKEIINKKRVLKEWLPTVEEYLSDITLTERIERHLIENKGFKQNKLGKALGVSGRDTKRIIDVLEKLDLIKKIKSENTYDLYLKDYHEDFKSP